MVVPFDRTFTGKDCDRFLFDRIWKTELPGVLNRALAGYRRVLKRQANFEPPLAVLDATERWLQQANPVSGLKTKCVKAWGRVEGRRFQCLFSMDQQQGYTLTQTQPTVDRNLSHLGFATKKGNQGKMVIGLALKTNVSPSPEYSP